MARRRGVVLGSGGILGLAWMVGALQAIENEAGFEPRTADVVVGTSAGSLLAALIGAGATTGQLDAHQRGEPLTDGPLAGVNVPPETVIDMRLQRPRPEIGSSRLVLSQLRREVDATPSSLIAGLMPPGRGSLAGLYDLVAATVARWPSQPVVQILAMDYDSGLRGVFGSPVEGSLPTDVRRVHAPPAVAVAASCSIPGWFAPTAVDGRRFVDGGSISVTSADLLIHASLDEAYVLAPMASAPRERSPLGWMVRRWRQHQIRRVQHEVAMLRASGVDVTLLTPTIEDTDVAGLNLMEPSRRREVLETSLRTSRETLAAYDRHEADSHPDRPRTA